MVRKQYYEGKDVWRTPSRITDHITETIDLDPCASNGEEVSSRSEIAETNYRLEDGDDGLEDEWFGTVFVNPPFSEKTEWLEKVYIEYENNNISAAYVVVPDSTDTKSWWHEYMTTADYIWFAKGRVSYIQEDGSVGNSPPFGTAVGMWGQIPTSTLISFASDGWVVSNNLK